MIRGEHVTVRIFRDGEVDDFGNPSHVVSEDIEVSDVLVAPGKTDDGTHEMSTTKRYNLHFPKGFDAPLRNAHVFVRGEELEVVGDPVPYTGANCPGKWSMTVEAVRADG